MNLFFDLDGTLLDSRKRLYLLFQELVPESTLSFESYWNLKRNQIPHREILQKTFFYDDPSFLRFEKAWMEMIELPEWLAYDKPFSGVERFLLSLKSKHRLYVVTARQFESVVLQQIKELGLLDIFSKILVTSQKGEKAELIKKNVSVAPSDWLIGDTGKDIQAGKLLGLKTAAVLSGFLSIDKLREYQPDLIVKQVTNLNFN